MCKTCTEEHDSRVEERWGRRWSKEGRSPGERKEDARKAAYATEGRMAGFLQHVDT